MRRGLEILFLFLIFVHPLFSQDSTKSVGEVLKESVELSGYVKHMNVGSWIEDDIGNLNNQNFFHNRLNFRGYIGKPLTVGIEVRNRLFYGEAVKQDPRFGDRILGQYPQRFDLSDLLVDERGVVLHSKVDRAWARFSKGKWEVTVGRQRINWSMNLAWNPNDLFNAYSFVDFDYEERPGSDAVRVEYYPGMMSSIGVAYRPGEEPDERIAALRYKFNKKGYDLQVLAGQYLSDAAIGVGWAGNLGDAGFKGEATYFHPYEEPTDTTGVVSASLTIDHMFPNSMYVAGGFLWNSDGITDPPRIPLNVFTQRITAKNLMPMEYSGLIQIQGQISPILNGGISAIWSPGVNALFGMPSLTYSIDEDWDLSLFGQTFFIENGRKDELENLGNGAYLRLRWSF